MTYIFKHQLEIGKNGESRLDKVFSDLFNITEATDAEQRQGIDRWFEPKAGGPKRAIEYKTCAWHAKNNNILIEILSVFNETVQKPGWIYSSQADWIIYYGIGAGKAYWFKPAAVKKDIRHLMKTHKIKAFKNPTYDTLGVIIPFKDFEPYVHSTTIVPEAPGHIF